MELHPNNLDFARTLERELVQIQKERDEAITLKNDAMKSLDPILKVNDELSVLNENLELKNDELKAALILKASELSRVTGELEILRQFAANSRAPQKL